MLHAEVGDYNKQIHNDIDYIKDHPITQFHLQTSLFMEDVMKLHKLHR